MILHQVFCVRGEYSEAATEALNQFLRSHRIVNVEKHFYEGAWHVWVDYQDGVAGRGSSGDARKGIDYRDVLTPAEFTLYDSLREWRRGLAQESDVVPFSIANNAQLADICQKMPKTLDELGKLPGLGKRRLEVYGAAILEKVAQHRKRQEARSEASGESN